ncbi:MAG: squalene/phytoene synthase family protein [Elusimicrobiota bacterium]|nr:squalene/phytoene synthase family protein [Elusimicrobiota bacterium]
MENQEKAHLSGEIKTILKKVSRTLYLSLNILPEPVRSSMGLGYLLCRALDTVVDTPGVQAADKLEIIFLARGLDKPDNSAALLKKIRSLSALPAPQGERELLLKFGKILSIYSSFPPEDRAVFSGLIHGVSSGLEMDVRTFPGGGPSSFAPVLSPGASEGRGPAKLLLSEAGPAAFKTARELELYCARTGGAPGVFWTRLYRKALRRSGRSGSTFPSENGAEMIGSALQMINILKDMAGDLRLGRCYLPQEDLDSRNMKPAELLLPSNMGRLRDITAKWMYWALDRLDLCEAFVSAIPKSEMAMRAAVIWPVYWAMDTLEEAAHSNLLDPADRPRVKRSRIYTTIAATPPLLLSNTAFARGYRFRRETLIGSITGGNYEGRAI